jgi:hypothetical protein
MLLEVGWVKLHQLPDEIAHLRRERGRADSRRDVNVDTARMRTRMAPDGTPD